MTVSRRVALASAGALLAMPHSPLAPSSANAGAPPVGKQAPGFLRWKVGDFEVTAINDGVVPRQIEQANIPNTPMEEIEKTLAANFMTRGGVNYFNTMIVNTGSKLVAIDSGFANNGAPTVGQMGANMAAAGIDPKNIDIVLISHFHGDHVSGLRTKEGAPVYPNAEVVIPQADWDFYMDEARMNATPEAGRGSFIASRRVFTPIAKDVRRLEWSKEVAPGITAIGSPGHTPGHTSFFISSGNGKLLVVGDASNDPRLFARNPHWHFAPDVDKPLAVETRKKLLDMAAAEKTQLSFYHAAFPATGFVVKDGAGFNWIPAAYNPIL